MTRRTFICISLVVALLAGAVLSGCMEVSLVGKQYDPTFYQIPRQLGDSLEVETPQFIIFGDPQAAWRAEHKFYRSENWFTWRHLLFPFYQIYILANGVIGAANYGRGVPDYGAETRASMRLAVSDAAEDIDADFIMILGDMVADGQRSSHWELFVREYAGPGDLLAKYPFLPLLGNHERANDTTFAYPNYQAVLDYPRFYVQKMDEAVMFVLDSNFIIDQYYFLDQDHQDRLFEEWFVSDDPSDPAWLQRKLEQYEDRTYKIIAMHHPIVTFAWHAYDWYHEGYGRQLPQKRKKLLDLFAEYNVDILFNGHEHLYEHNILRYEAPTTGSGILHTVTSSGAGTPVRQTATLPEFRDRMQQYQEHGIDVTNVLQRSVYHFTQVTVAEENMIVETYQVDPSDPLDEDLLERIVIQPAEPVAAVE